MILLRPGKDRPVKQIGSNSENIAFLTMEAGPTFLKVKAALASAIAVHEEDCGSPALTDNFPRELDARSELLSVAQSLIDIHTDCSMAAAILVITAFWSV